MLKRMIVAVVIVRVCFEVVVRMMDLILIMGGYSI